jgi:hypothetical protein
MVRRLDPNLVRVAVRPVARRRAGTLLWLLVGGLAGCTAELKDPGDLGPPPPPLTGPIEAAFLAKVDVRGGVVTVSPPELRTTGALRDDQASHSLVGGDVVTLVSSNFAASAIGAFTPGKIRVQFDLALNNRLSRVSLTGPSAFPAPPPGTTGPLVFPYDIAVATTSGGTSGGNNEIIVVLPSRGVVAPSVDWDGTPFNFFNDADCTVAASVSDCFRWEEYPGPILTGATAAGRRVGFDIDPTVGQFTARILVAADIVDPNVPSPGAVQGQVVSATLGPLAGVTVVVTPPGQAVLTTATGSFQLANVPSGTVSLTLSGLPSACTVPPPTPVLVPAGGVATVTVPVDCAPPPLLGTITGSITNQLGTPLAGVTIQATPTGLSPTPTTLSGAAGDFSLVSIPVSDGTGVLILGALPGTCVDPGPIPYTGLTTGGPLTIGLVVNCP